ncbi:hypothetical protein [Xanthomonas arboricola]|uniref:hypothetical protein n=1 Tax=Xanthomonas arboricola TaxID=56448 RepID=UPI0012D32405|nr:hypothetical protein [Xanthomonas arboricola]
MTISTFESVAGMLFWVCRVSPPEFPQKYSCSGRAAPTVVLLQRSDLERLSAQPIDVGLELGRWRRTEKNRSIQDLIDFSRGQVSEAQRTPQLKTNVAEERARIESLSKLSGALDSLATVPSAQIEDIHDSVVAILPQWQALLRRIVRDQRFAQTELDFYSHYKNSMRPYWCHCMD